MAKILTKRDGVIVLGDGTRSFVIANEVGDVATTEASTEVNIFLDRGEMSDAGSARRVDSTPAEISFSAYLTEAVDSASTVSLPGLLMWARGDDSGDAGIAEIIGDGWTSTTSQPDGLRTLNVDWYPDGNATGNVGYRLADAIVAGTYSEGDPTSLAITAKSITAAKLARVVAP